MRKKIKPGAGNLRVHFAALTFVAPERVRFAYRLSGIDEGWNYTSDRVAAYGNLPPGAYRFQVIACNNDGVWNNNGATITFEIAPHYYQTWWFRILMGLLGGSAIVGIFAIRTLQLRRRTVELEAKVDERTAELRDSNDQLEAAKSELEAAFEELSDSNSQLEEIQAELESQNAELLETREILAKANERLEDLATTDGLTGLKNHRAFQDQLSIEWQQFQRSLHPLSIVLMDVDKFKQYNDTYGHPGGDEVLRRVAQLISENVREADFVARYGGEEFVVIAPNTGHDGAVQLAERIRTAIEQAEWPLRAVTASLGVSTATPVTESAAALVAEADAALYQSKEGGRNRVTPFHGAESVNR
jgi:diguanylate cyclase (GGDEF)-like protein